jgi:hypothetical protein
MPSSVQFELKGGSPLRLEVTLPNGEKYDLRVAMSVTDVVLLDGPDPTDPSLPAFNIQANFAATTKKLSGSAAPTKPRTARGRTSGR